MLCICVYYIYIRICIYYIGLKNIYIFYTYIYIIQCIYFGFQVGFDNMHTLFITHKVK